MQFLGCNKNVTEERGTKNKVNTLPKLWAAPVRRNLLSAAFNFNEVSHTDLPTTAVSAEKALDVMLTWYSYM